SGSIFSWGPLCRCPPNDLQWGYEPRRRAQLTSTASGTTPPRVSAGLEIMQHRSAKETEPVTSTVDHADIRGLGTTLLVSVGCLPRSRREGLSHPRNAHENCPPPGAAPLARIGVAPHVSFVLGDQVTSSRLGPRRRRPRDPVPIPWLQRFG